MPKEIINHVRHPDDMPKGSWQEAQFSLHWTGSLDDSGHSDAQISIELDWDQIEALVQARKEDTLAPQSGVHRDGTVSIYSGSLSRYELNRLVKNARRARDAVHGADE